MPFADYKPFSNLLVGAPIAQGTLQPLVLDQYGVSQLSPFQYHLLQDNLLQLPGISCRSLLCICQCSRLAHIQLAIRDAYTQWDDWQKKEDAHVQCRQPDDMTGVEHTWIYIWLSSSDTQDFCCIM